MVWAVWDGFQSVSWAPWGWAPWEIKALGPLRSSPTGGIHLQNPYFENSNCCVLCSSPTRGIHFQNPNSEISSFLLPVQAPLPGESIFRIPILKIQAFWGLCRLPYRGNPFSESCLQAGGISWVRLGESGWAVVGHRPLKKLSKNPSRQA